MLFHKSLINWYLKNKRDLPWRKTQNPYHIWLSEIMLQQTRVAQGLPYFLRFTEAFPTVFDLANAPESQVLKLWQGLGYYSRARNLHYTAKYIEQNLDGKFPENYTELKKLKGVGDYTASAIASICFKEPTAVVDGNVYRVLSRYYGVDTPVNSTKGIKFFKELAQSLIDTEQPDIYNQAIMEFGALQCKPKKPDCLSCPLNDSCVALEKKLIDTLPVKEKKIKIKKRFFNFIIIETDSGETVIEERTQKGIWQNLYQFPLIETKESINEKTLLRNIHFENWFYSDIELSLFNEKEIIHKLSHQHLYTKFWVVKTPTTSLTSISWDEVSKYPVPILIANFLNRYKNINN